jgi:glutamyl-tRNA reductase
VLLSTCNRTEFYHVGDDASSELLKTWLRQSKSLDASINGALFEKSDDDAIKHLYRVASGLDSLVLGEPQILGQLKEAYREAQTAGTAGKSLTQVFQHSFSAAKKVRTDTDIGANPVSVAYAAVDLARQFFSNFKKHTALLVGAGMTIELAARHLKGRGIGRLFIANRSLERARSLATQVGGYAVPLTELGGTLPEADILICSTAAPEPIITIEHMQAAIKARKRRPIFAVDIAVPRDIHPDVANLTDVYLYTVDDLDKVILEGMGSREAAALDANRILDDEIERYLGMQRAKQVAPVITTLRSQAENVREEVMRQAQRRLAQGADPADVIEYATAAVMKKILHTPSVRLREAAEAGDDALVDATRSLFGLDNKPR